MRWETPTSRLIGRRRRCAAVMVSSSFLAQDDPSRHGESRVFGKYNSVWGRNVEVFQSRTWMPKSADMR